MEALTSVQHLLERFGGHAQAAGLTIKKENLGEFKKEFTKLVEAADLSDAKKSIIIDQQIKIRDINTKLLEELIIMEPFGQGNKKPVFLSTQVVIRKISYLGDDKKHLKIWIADGVNELSQLELISFNYQNNLEDLKKSAKQKLQEGDKVSIVYTLEENIWNGRRSIQGRIIDLEV
jgi:single-stranded-DNA-specific exonuclease